MCRCFFIILLLNLSENFSPASSQLSAMQSYANARLPGGRDDTAAVYDGNDSIYILGGWGRLPDYDNTRGTASMDGNGDIYYYGGWGPGDVKGRAGELSRIYKYSPYSGAVGEVSRLPSPDFYSSALKFNDATDDIYILGGLYHGNAIVGFNTVTFKTERLGNLSIDYTYMTAVSDGKGSAFIFGNSNFLDTNIQPVTKVKPPKFEDARGPATVPPMGKKPVSVWDGRYAYVLGGYGYLNPNSTRTDAIIQFNPETMRSVVIQVENFPVNGSRIFFGTSAIYVGMLDRIYFFGGFSSVYNGPDPVYHDDIWYIDLSPLRQSMI